MRNLLATLLFSTAALACSKATTDTAPAATAPAAATDPAPAPAPAAAPAPAPAPAAPAPAAAPVAAADPAPDLVEAAPGVQVIADYDAPVFYTGGHYWRHDGTRWYSSATYTGGWELNAAPPTAIVHIDRPERFVHYKPSGYVARNHPAPPREWHPEVHAEVQAPHAEVHVEPPHAEVHIDPGHASIHVEPPHATVHVDPPRVGVHVDPRAEVRVTRP
jgi:hypothetical protein